MSPSHRAHGDLHVILSVILVAASMIHLRSYISSAKGGALGRCPRARLRMNPFDCGQFQRPLLCKSTHCFPSVSESCLLVVSVRTVSSVFHSMITRTAKMAWKDCLPSLPLTRTGDYSPALPGGAFRDEAFSEEEDKISLGRLSQLSPLQSRQWLHCISVKGLCLHMGFLLLYTILFYGAYVWSVPSPSNPFGAEPLNTGYIYCQ
jgi:hypothetical protein